jgi:hypothetical protein
MARCSGDFPPPSPPAERGLILRRGRETPRPPALSELPAEPSDQSAPLQHGRRAHRRRLRRISLPRYCRALSRLDYDQLRAVEPGLGLARPLCRSKELRPCQRLHDLPPVGWWLVHHDQIMPLITAISWLSNPTTQPGTQMAEGPRRASSAKKPAPER